MKTLAIANHKGGVGKTAIAHTLAEALSAGRRVLLIDADPQGSLTAACGIHDAARDSLAKVLGGSQPGELAMREILRELSPTLPRMPEIMPVGRISILFRRFS